MEMDENGGGLLTYLQDEFQLIMIRLGVKKVP